jgi:hypothetical protein
MVKEGLNIVAQQPTQAKDVLALLVHHITHLHPGVSNPIRAAKSPNACVHIGIAYQLS